MSTTLTHVDIIKDQWVSVPATWDAYMSLLRARGGRPRPRYTFLEGRLTIVSPGHTHESLAARVSGLIQEVLVGLSIRCHASGQVTLLASHESRGGTEADASYYLTNIDRVLGKHDLVMGDDPPPDLVVEVVVSHPVHDALEAYRRMGVGEVWVCKESGLEFLVLDAGRYGPSPTSRCFPSLRSDEIAEWVYRDDPAGDTAVWKAFRAWVVATLLPRHQGT